MRPSPPPISTINYSYYDDKDEIVSQLISQMESLQCVVGKNLPQLNPLPFGITQQPSLADYADGIDTITFLEKL